MVHALIEAHRTLGPGGIMIDMRPLCVDVPLEVIYTGGKEAAGMIDLSPEIERDISADNAINTTNAEGIYKEIKVEYFDFTYYWQTIKDMQDDLKEYWQGEVIISNAVWRRTHALFRRNLPGTQILVALRMKLGVYEKLQTTGSRDDAR